MQLKNDNTLRSQRSKSYKELLKKNFVEYNEDDWFDVAVRYESDSATIGTSDVKTLYFWKEDFQDSDWYKFQEAVKEHQKKAEAILQPTFARMEVAKLVSW